VNSIGNGIASVRRRVKRPATVALGFDLLFGALVALAVAAELAGEFDTRVAGLRISMKTTWRILAWAVVVATLRHLLVPRPSMLNRLWDRQTADAERRLIELVAPLSPAAWFRRLVWLVAIFAVLTAAVLFPHVAQPYGVPDLGDPLFSIWRLSWIAHQLPRDPLRLFDANIFHPHSRTLAYSDATLVPALAAAPLLWAGVHQVLVYNLLFFAAIAFSGVTTFVLMHALTGRRSAALVSGLLFAFASFRFAHYAHLELQMIFWTPLALYWLHRMLVTGRKRYGLLTGIAVGLQTLSSIYYGMFAAIFMAVLAVALRLAGHFTIRRVVPATIAAVICAAVIIGPYALPYLHARDTVGERARHEIDAFSARPADYLGAHSRSVHRRWLGGSVNGERELFPGVVPLALAAIALWPPISPVRLAYAAAVAVAFDASLGFNGDVYHWLHAYVPPFRGLRAPARFAMLVAFGLSVLAGYGFGRVTGLFERRLIRVPLALAITTLALVELRPSVTLEAVWKTPPGMYGALPADRTAVLAEFPFPETQVQLVEEARAMYFSTFHWHRLVNGNSGFFPPDYHALRQEMQRFPSDESMAMLRRYGVEYVALHKKFYDPGKYVSVTEDLDGRCDVTLVSMDRWERSETRLYRLSTCPP